jgi:hypothetical protein
MLPAAFIALASAFGVAVVSAQNGTTYTTGVSIPTFIPSWNKRSGAMLNAANVNSSQHTFTSTFPVHYCKADSC